MISKKLIVIILILFFFNQVSGLDYFLTTSVTYEMIVNGSLQPKGSVEAVNLTIHAAPLDSQIIKHEGGLTMSNNTLTRAYEKLNTTTNYETRITFTKTLKPIVLTYLEPLNYNNYSEQIKQYLEFDEYTRPTSEIKQLANKLVQGLQYKLEAALIISSYVHDYVKYDLNIGGNELIPAEWVYENRVGTCDEYSVLAASMMRVVGIPVRFVHAYVNVNDSPGFWAHSYLEAYLSGEWVPLDPTWDQQGTVDLSHVPLKKTFTPVFQLIETRYSYLINKPAELISETPKIVFETKSVEQKPIINTSVTLEKNETTGGNYVLLTITAHANSKGVIVLPVQIITTKTVEKVKGYDYIIIKNGTGTSHHLLKTPGVREGFYELHPIQVKVMGSQQKNLTLKLLPGTPTNNEKNYDKYFTPQLNLTTEIEATVQGVENFYGRNTNFTIKLKNVGTAPLQNLEITIPQLMFEKNTTLGINEEKSILINTELEYGEHEITILIKNGERTMHNQTLKIKNIPKNDYSFNPYMENNELFFNFSTTNYQYLKKAVIIINNESHNPLTEDKVEYKGEEANMTLIIVDELNNTTIINKTIKKPTFLNFLRKILKTILSLLQLER